MAGGEGKLDLAITLDLPTRYRLLEGESNRNHDDQLLRTKSTNRRCQLLALPTEIRVDIYRQLFKGAYLTTDALNCSHCLPLKRFPFKFCACSFPWQVVSTCRQLRDEATSYLFSAAALHFYGTMRPKSTPEPALLSAIPRVVVEDTVRYWNQQALDLNPFHGLKTLELRNIIIWCKYHDEAYLQSTEGDDCMLQLALFNLNRIHPDLKRICAASDRSFEILLWCQYVVSSSTHETIHAVIDVDKQVVLRKFKGPANRDRNAWAGFY